MAELRRIDPSYRIAISGAIADQIQAGRQRGDNSEVIADRIIDLLADDDGRMADWLGEVQ